MGPDAKLTDLEDQAHRHVRHGGELVELLPMGCPYTFDELLDDDDPMANTQGNHERRLQELERGAKDIWRELAEQAIGPDAKLTDGALRELLPAGCPYTFDELLRKIRTTSD